MRANIVDGKRIYKLTEEEYKMLIIKSRERGRKDVKDYLAFWFKDGFVKRFGDMMVSLAKFLNGESDTLPSKSGVSLSEFNMD